MRRRSVFALALALVTAVSFTMGAPSASAAEQWVPVAVWQMNEPAGSTRLVDSSGNGVTAPIGTAVGIGVRDGTSTVHRFSYISTTAPAAPSARLHVVPDRASLDPGTQGFAVEVRFRTHAGNRNIMQKGQSGTTGGFWKIEISGGVATCVFRGSKGSVGMKSTSSVEDSKWHVVRCVRLAAGGAELYLDGVRQARTSTVSGLIDNKIELSIGGKSRCNNTTVSCDYFHGDIDYARIDRLQSTAGTSAAPVTAPISTAPTTAPTTTAPTTTAPTTAAPTTTVPALPPARPPSGRYDAVEVDGRSVTVRGLASDPNGVPSVRISSTWSGGRTTFDRPASNGAFAASFTAEPGEHTVCVSVLDVPTGSAVSLGCKPAVVK